MATNKYFRSYTSPGEQALLNDLSEELIQRDGIDVLYVPRALVAFDRMYGEDMLSAFNTSYEIEMYVANFNNYEGDGDILSKFGLEVRDEIRLTVNKGRFTQEVTAKDASIKFPREGDLIWFLIDKKIYEISWVNRHETFAPLGKTFNYEINCRLFTISGEQFNTGIHDVDDVEIKSGYSQTLTLISGFGAYELGEEVYQGSSLISSTFSGKVVSWNDNDQILKINRTKGVLNTSVVIVGDSSGSTFTVGSDESNTNEPLQDNVQVQTEAEVNVDFDEDNPFLNEI